jgi:hypothetical protein
MGTRGKNINFYLMDGDPRGRIKCTLANWTGVAYKIPRIELEKCKGRDDLAQSGVYFLIGASDETFERVVYIGQAGIRKNGEGILYRFQEHKRNKDYWTETVVFTTSNNSFGATEISYLEHRFTSLAMEAKRYTIKNGNNPTPGNVTEEKENELEEFLDYAKIVMGTLGYKVFDPLVDVRSVVDQDRDGNGYSQGLLYMTRKSRKSRRTVEARCKQTAEGFVVLKGSSIETNDSESIPHRVKSARQNANIDDHGILQEDVLFQSPSYAASFVSGDSANGLTSWKTYDGKTLKDIEK